MTSRIKTRKGREKRDALVAACADLFWRKGYEAASLADIADHAGVPLGNVYYYFRSKTDMAEAVADVFVKETEDLIDAISSEAEKPHARLALLVKRLSQTARSRVDHGCPIGGCILSFNRHAPVAARRAGEAFSLLVGFAARELQRGGLRPSAAMAAARGAVADWQGGIMLAHALQDVTVMAESFRRMERSFGQGRG